MAPPSITSSFQPASAGEPFFASTSMAFPTTAPPFFMGVSDDSRKNGNDDLMITTIENKNTCGWFSGALSSAFECSSSSSCVTNTDNLIACSKKNDESLFFWDCIDLDNASEQDCTISGVLCCSSLNPSCMTLLWTASPTRSLLGCDAIHSTWTMLDYPFGMDQSRLTSTSNDLTTSTSSEQAHPTSPSSSETAHLSSNGQSPGTSNTHPSNSDSHTQASSQPPSPSSPSGSNSNTLGPAPGSSLLTFTITTPTASRSASPLPINHGPAPPASDGTSTSLSTGAEAGIGVGASAGLLIILALIAAFLFKKRHARNDTQPQDAQPQQQQGEQEHTEHTELQHDTFGPPLRDNPSGNLPADMAPPARTFRSPSPGWTTGAASTRRRTTATTTTADDNDNDFSFFDLAEGSSEVPVDMQVHGQHLDGVVVVGAGAGVAAELPGSPVEMAPVGDVARSEYDEYRMRVAEYRRGPSFQNSRSVQGPVSYRGPTF